MENQEMDIQKQIRGILPTAREVIVNPKNFYANMPKTGGFLQPLVFMIALGIASVLVASILSLLRLSPAGGIFTGLAAIIVAPIILGIFGFLVAAVLFVFWKLIGSRESYQTAYRCMAYTSAILPITTMLNLIPYVGMAIGLIWVTYLLVVASTEAHGIKAKTAWAGFGTICALFVLITVTMETASRKMMQEMQVWEASIHGRTGNLDRVQDMSPEEAGKALGEFFRGLQESAEEKR